MIATLFDLEALRFSRPNAEEISILSPEIGPEIGPRKSESRCPRNAAKKYTEFGIDD